MIHTRNHLGYFCATPYYRYGRHYEQDDLVGYGNLGLVKAAHKYASLRFDIRQAIGFADYAKKRIWREVEAGRNAMSTLGRDHYRLVKKGLMARPRFVRESEAYCLSDAISTLPPERDEEQGGVMMAWMRKQKPLWAEVVDLHVRQGMTFDQIGQRIDRSASATASLCRRAVNMLRWQYNRPAYRRDDRTARRHKHD